MNAQAVFPSDTSPQLGAPTDAALAQRFDPVFARIAEGALARERERILAHEPVAWLRAAGFGAVRVPQAHGGLGASLPQLLRLLARLGEADSNLPQILRAHFGFVEGLYGSTADDAALRARWFPRVAAGALFGAAMAERGPATENTLTLRRDGAHWQLDGEKFYSTGTLYADWILAAAVDGGDQLALAVPADAQGVTRIDDWDGFGQRLTGSGSTHFRAVRLQDEHVLHRHPAGQARPDNYLTAFYQSVHLATLTGIARAVLRDGVEFVRARTRVFGVPGQTRPPTIHWCSGWSTACRAWPSLQTRWWSRSASRCSRPTSRIMPAPRQRPITSPPIWPPITASRWCCHWCWRPARWSSRSVAPRRPRVSVRWTGIGATRAPSPRITRRSCANVRLATGD
ncbi:hypothetical protein LPY95_17645 [Xanthomonas citri pv. malvacearum]|uniref:acyl-CoA dehydrogenase family protein n=1 Tax=Xanthomonas citri TaxID=346 RepID=UPI0022AE78E4|nr:acyl-CoA dehydrogenase family protein [Xanthomonas citri]WAW90464.1 hypothetical protein LPY95_17645 [Xanthomonas citri pv. malvacearum]